MKIRGFLVALALLSGVATAQAASVPTVNSQNLQIPATGADFNAVINSINTILAPLTGGASAGGVNAISLTPAGTGYPAQITLQPGADPNAGILINPNGSGNITLFGAGDTGVLQLGNSAGFVPANGLAACPGINPRNLPLGMKGVVSGFFAMQDWLGRNQWSLTCG
jgi:hypothetical protein